MIVKLEIIIYYSAGVYKPIVLYFYVFVICNFATPIWGEYKNVPIVVCVLYGVYLWKFMYYHHTKIARTNIK